MLNGFLPQTDFANSEETAFLQRIVDAAWHAVRFAVDDEESAEAANLRRRLRTGVLRVVAQGERNPVRIVDSVLADLPPMTARYSEAM